MRQIKINFMFVLETDKNIFQKYFLKIVKLQYRDRTRSFMSFSQKQAVNHHETILQIKRKYLNRTSKPQGQQLSQTPLTDKKLPSNDQYYQSPSKKLNSIGQSNIQNKYLFPQNSTNDTCRVNKESSNVSMRDYITLKVEYKSKHKNDNSLAANLKNKGQNTFGHQSQSIQNRGIQRQFNKNNQVHNFGSEADDLANKQNKERNAKLKELKQAQRCRANEALDLKQKNHKVIEDIQQMVMRIRNSLKERIC